MCDDFFHLQLKDIITAVIAAAAFMVALANLHSTYLRKARIKLEIVGPLHFARMSSPEQLYIRASAYLFNEGAQPMLVTDMQLCLWAIYPWWRFRRARRHVIPWQDILSLKNIASAGGARKLHWEFEKKAVAEVIPKYDVVEKDVAFYGPAPCNLHAGKYVFTVVGAGIKGTARRFKSSRGTLIFDEDDIAFLDKETLLVNQVRSQHLAMAPRAGIYRRER